MRVGEIVGKVTLSTWHPQLRGASWRLVVPFNLDNLSDPDAKRDEPFVIYDELGAGNGTLVAIAEGPEASAPFYPEQKPIDGYNAAIIDELRDELK
ncbi:EutN/CcmL family microcompartment protein [Rubinisphaera margarita]|uniref:EutN/CcmL family microcompartment protein n=1 Tax=Rubinisphaera margarita TaxID=2909586 RepID=UPI001EE98C5C|nr:EutN/CcmL family microcompartment protein [Rubinisphaera margarita]MCG6156844.1 carbon dioxide concentrating mechanism protein CcmL [Rubinisphaera margarita]